MYRRTFNLPWWREMNEFQRDMNRLFSSYIPARSPFGAGYPAMNLWVNDEEALVTAEIPGVKMEDMDISVIGETLTLKGTHATEDVPEDASCYRQERSSGSFSRTIELPFRVDSDKVEAVFDKGVLRVKMPRAEQDKPKKISIKAG